MHPIDGSVFYFTYELVSFVFYVNVQTFASKIQNNYDAQCSYDGAEPTVVFMMKSIISNSRTKTYTSFHIEICHSKLVALYNLIIQALIVVK